MKEEKQEKIVNKIVNVLVNEKCTVSESKSLLFIASKEIEKSPTVQISHS